MDNDNWDPNGELVCPYDSTHVISVKRFQRHILKCRQNHPDKDYVTCPFNAKHIFLREQLRSHLSFCPDRGKDTSQDADIKNQVLIDHDVIRGITYKERFKFMQYISSGVPQEKIRHQKSEQCPETGDMLRLKGKTAIPKQRCHVPDDPNEDWDTEIEEHVAVKLEEQDSYLRTQGFLHDKNACTRLRRPNISLLGEPRQDEWENIRNVTQKKSSCFPDDLDDISSLVSDSSKTSSSLYPQPVKQKTNSTIDDSFIKNDKSKIPSKCPAGVNTLIAVKQSNSNNGVSSNTSHRLAGLGRGALSLKLQHSNNNIVKKHSLSESRSNKTVENQVEDYGIKGFGRGKLLQAFQ